MKLTVICNGCKQMLSIKDKSINFASNELVLEVNACRNKDCYVCGDCEEVKAREEAEEKLKAIKEKGETRVPSCFGTWASRHEGYISKTCSGCSLEEDCKSITLKKHNTKK